MEKWVDCGFLRLPTHSDFETIFLEQDQLMAIIPKITGLPSIHKSDNVPQNID